MNIRPAFTPNAQAPLLIEPGPGSLYHPSMPAQSLRGLDAPAGNAGNDPASAPRPARGGGSIGFIGMQLHQPFPRTAQRTFTRRQRLEGREQHIHVVDIGCRERTGQRDALAFDPNMALRARFAVIRWSRPGCFAPFSAGPVGESIAARLQSIWSASPSQFKKMR